MILAGLNSMDELDKLETSEQKKNIRKKQGRKPNYFFLLVKR
jgi:hypothetical protein